MKHLRLLLVALAVSVLTVGAQAGNIFRFGPKVGTEINTMRFDESAFSAENRAGFTGGLMFEANVPVIGLCFDLSVMYVHRVNSASIDGTADPDASDLFESSNFKKRDYIEIPVHVKYRFGLPVVGSFLAPYIFTGPSFGILASKTEINNAYKNKSFDVSWNIGAGLQLFSHLQLSASYSLGISKTLEKVSNITSGPEIDGRNNYWTVTAAWLF